jgi:bifunctional glutamyl/prolyl-tRNA synthetase
MLKLIEFTSKIFSSRFGERTHSFLYRNNSGDIELIEGETQLDNKDFKNTLKLTWLAETSQAPITPVTCVHYDNIMTKVKLDEGDTFENFVNYASKVNDIISNRKFILIIFSSPD